MFESGSYRSWAGSFGFARGWLTWCGTPTGSMSEGRDDGPAPAAPIRDVPIKDVPIRDVPMEDVLKSDVSSTPPHPQVGHWQAPARKVFGPLLRGLWSAEVEGIEHVPTDGPALIAPNHISFIDSMFVLALLPRRTLAVGKAEYMDSWKTKWFPAIGMIPLDRSAWVSPNGVRHRR